jgi:hypothetical protein
VVVGCAVFTNDRPRSHGRSYGWRVDAPGEVGVTLPDSADEHATVQAAAARGIALYA